jgi:hypothetical protein
MERAREPAPQSGTGLRAFLALPIALWLAGGCGRIEYAQSGPDGNADGGDLDGALARDASAGSGDGGELDANFASDAGMCSPATCAWGCSGDLGALTHRARSTHRARFTA